MPHKKIKRSRKTIYKIRYHPNGYIKCIYYKRNKSSPDTDKPSLIKYHTNGKVLALKWIVNNKLHRLDGPAAIILSSDGKTRHTKYCIDGKPIDRQVYKRDYLKNNFDYFDEKYLVNVVANYAFN